MKWGFFTPVHFATLALAALIIGTLYFCLRKASRKTQTLVLGILSFSGIAAIIYNLVMWGAPLQYLPLELCSLNALLLPWAVLKRSKTVGNLLLVWCLGALAALILNTEMADADVFSHVFAFYYFPHVLEFGIPLLLVWLGHIQKDPRCIGPTIGITMLIYTGVYGINKLINAYCAVHQIQAAAGGTLQVNYMFSMQPNNPLSELFYKVIPYEYWYMYMIIPILLVYLLILYAPQLIRKKQKKTV